MDQVHRELPSKGIDIKQLRQVLWKLVYYLLVGKYVENMINQKNVLQEKNDKLGYLLS